MPKGSVGVPCPACHAPRSGVVDSRPNRKTGMTRRRRECCECSFRFTTWEAVDPTSLPPPAPPTLQEAVAILAKALQP